MLWAALAASLGFHVLLLSWPNDLRIRPAGGAAPRMTAELLPPPEAPAIGPAVPHATPSSPARRPASTSARSRQTEPARTQPARNEGVAAIEEGRREAPGPAYSASSAQPTINLEQARGIARDAARSLDWPKSPDSVARRDSPEAVLARRLLREQPVGETRMADGTAVLRFSDGVCMTVPPHLPSRGMAEIVPTLVVPGNCPGSMAF